VKCVDCGTLTYGTYLCSECHEKRLKEKIVEDALKVDIEHPSNKYF